MARFMLDTDISSYILKRSSAPVLRRLQTVSVQDVCISVITKAELLYGVEISPRRSVDELAVSAFLRWVAVLDFPEKAAMDYARIRARLKAGGEMIGGNDLFIAAHARCLGLTLVTNNVQEFRRIPELKIENWTEDAD